MSDLSELNKQLSSLSKDFETHQQWNEVRQNQINDEKYNKMNTKWQEYQTFNTTQNTPYSQPNDPGNNPKLPLQNQQLSTQQLSQQTIPQIQQPQSKFTRMENYQVLHQPDNQYYQNQQQQQQQNQQQQDLRQDMNYRMDRFRFDSASNMKHTLVPVDMNHYYSGNLFMEGSPIPNNLPENVEDNKLNSGFKNQSRLLHQEKSKTLYRNDVNKRIANFSPLGRTLHFPVNQNTDTISENIMTKTSRKNEMKADINSRLSGYTPLSNNTPILENNNYSRNEIAPNNNSNSNNNQNNNVNYQQKIKYQEMMPVSST